MDLGISKNISLGLPRQPNPAQNFLIESALLLIVCGLFTWFIILPKQSEIGTKQVALDKLLEQHNKLKSDTETLQRLVKSLAQHKDDITKLDKALPLDFNLPQAQTIINQMAKAVNVDLQGSGLSGIQTKVSAGDKQLLSDPFKPARTLQKASGDITVKGNFDQLVSFLQELEASGRLFNINKMQIDSSSDGTLNLRVNVVTYVFGTN